MASHGKVTSETDDLPQHIYRWLESVQRRLASDLETVTSDAVQQVGFRRLRILQLVQPGGTRQQELAERALMTKQAIADFVDALETEGLVDRTPDPVDGRAWLIVRTKAGDRINEDLNAAIGAVEFEMARDVGKDRYKTFMGVLRELGKSKI